MKIEVEAWKLKCSVLEVESLDGLRSIRITDTSGIRCDRFLRPHTAAYFHSDDEKRCYGNVRQALEDNIAWLTQSK